jgi:NAD-dependent dihydropyrimidine dehydrogenase PreA subunit
MLAGDARGQLSDRRGPLRGLPVAGVSWPERLAAGPAEPPLAGGPADGRVWLIACDSCVPREALSWRRVGFGILVGSAILGRVPLTGIRPRLEEEFGVTYIIALPCVDVLDRACIEECPVDCIYEGERMLYIHPDECVDCGACEPVCPVEAIYYEDDVPSQWKDYYKVNVEFFEDLGSPGGASKTGKIGKDHPIVAALPPQETEH